MTHFCPLRQIFSLLSPFQTRAPFHYLHDIPTEVAFSEQSEEKATERRNLKEKESKLRSKTSAHNYFLSGN
jgi:hypothetical protein